MQDFNPKNYLDRKNLPFEGPMQGKHNAEPFEGWLFRVLQANPKTLNLQMGVSENRGP